MNYNSDSQVLTFNVFISNHQLAEQQRKPELEEGYTADFIKLAVEELSKALLKSDLISAEKQYNIEKQGYMHHFSVRVAPPQQ